MPSTRWTPTRAWRSSLPSSGLILEYQEKGNQALDAGANLSDVVALPVREQIGRAKYIPESEMKRFEQIESDLSSQCAALMDEGGEG